MELYLVQHGAAKTEAEDPQRSLTEEGMRTVERMGEHLAALALALDTDLVNPNFAKLAQSADILGIRVERPEDLRLVLTEALAHDGPALVDVVVNRQELAMPPTINVEQALGFSLYMIAPL